MKAPACDPGDFCIAQRAESTLFMPEIAKSACTPKRFQHVSLFPFFEVGFIGWIVRVSFAFDLDVPFKLRLEIENGDHQLQRRDHGALRHIT